MNRFGIQSVLAAGGAALLASTAAAIPQDVNESGFSLTAFTGAFAGLFDFGVDIAADSGRIAVGATGRTEPSGAVFVYDDTTGAYLYGVVPPAGAGAIEDFGTQVALVGDTLVVTDNSNLQFMSDPSQVFV